MLIFSLYLVSALPLGCCHALVHLFQCQWGKSKLNSLRGKLCRIDRYPSEKCFINAAYCLMSFSVVPVTRWETFHWGETFLNDLCSLVIQVSPVSTVACLGFCPWPEEQPAWLRIRDCPTFLSDCCARYLSLCSGRACSNSSAFFRRNLESDVE